MWKDILRWIMVLPASTIGGFAGGFMALSMLAIAWGMHGEPFFFKNLIQDVFTNIFFVIGFVLSGASIAPNHKVKTILVLVILICLLSIVTIIYNISNSNFLSTSTASMVAAMITAVFVYIYYLEKEIK